MANKKLFIFLVLLVSFYISWDVIYPVLFDNAVVQDDFRLSMYWMWNFWDADLFQNDFVKDNYSGVLVQVPFFWILYKLAPLFTDNLLFYSKFLAFVIALATSYIAYIFFEKLSASRALSLTFVIALSSMLWCTDHVSIAFARSLIWALVLLHMYFKLESKHLASALTCTFALLASPIAFLLCLGMEFFDLALRNYKELFNFKNISTLFMALNAALTLILYKVIFPGFLKHPTYADSEVFSVAELKLLPELNPGGRHPIFGSSIWDGSWWHNEHWGLGVGFLEISKIIPVALVLLGIFVVCFFIFKEDKALIKTYVNSPLALLFYSSASLYVFSQPTFPLLYMPSRYIGISSLILAITLIFLIANYLLGKLFSFVFESSSEIAQVAIFLIMLVSSIFFWTYYKHHYFTRFVKMDPGVQAAVEALDKDALIAGHPLLPDLNILPAVAKRRVFMDYEHTIASFNKDVLAEVRRRNKVSLRLIYASSREEVLQLMKDNGITHILVHSHFYSNRYLSNPRYMEPYNAFLLELLRNSKGFYLAKYLRDNKSNYSLLSYEKLASL